MKMFPPIIVSSAQNRQTRKHQGEISKYKSCLEFNSLSDNRYLPSRFKHFRTHRKIFSFKAFPEGKIKSVIKVVIISVSSKAILKTVNKAVGVNSINIPTQLEITTYTCRVPGLSGKQTGKRQ